MKRVSLFCTLLFVLSFVSMICISCSKEDAQIDEPKDPTLGEKPEEKIEYYVKYESNVSIPLSKHIDIDLTVVTEKGVQDLKVPRTWEGFFGPFNELTTLRITSRTIGYNVNMTSCSGRISICSGNQPFILKNELYSNGTSFTLKYKVVKEDLK